MPILFYDVPINDVCTLIDGALYSPPFNSKYKSSTTVAIYVYNQSHMDSIHLSISKSNKIDSEYIDVVTVEDIVLLINERKKNDTTSAKVVVAKCPISLWCDIINDNHNIKHHFVDSKLLFLLYDSSETETSSCQQNQSSSNNNNNNGLARIYTVSEYNDCYLMWRKHHCRGIYKSFEEFEAVFNRCTKDFGNLVFNGSSKGDESDISKQVFYYKSGQTGSS